MRLLVLHYDLLPGGVSDSIVGSVRAVCTGGGDIAVTIVCGRAEHADAVVDALRRDVCDLRLEVWPEVDSSDPSEGESAAAARSAVIVSRLRNELDPTDDVLWVHNYHIGTNPALTAAICSICAVMPELRTLLHIHDFPEDGRYANLAYLERIAGRSPYPAGENVRYVVGNERDAALLRATDIPDVRVHCIPDPLPRVDNGPGGVGEDQPVRAVRPNRDRLVAGLAAFARQRGHVFHPDGPLIIYPVRAIRRKNVLELAAMCRLVERTNLIVTLPGTSNADRDYSEMIEFAYARERAHGVFGIGTNEHRYGLTPDDLTHGADLVASSSVQEGFGLLFINALRWRVPLFARRLDVLSGIEPLFDGYPARFYESFTVPTRCPSVRSMRGYLQMRYAERLAELPERAHEKAHLLRSEINRLCAEPTIDFSLLPAQLQMAVLGDLDDAGFAREVSALNEPTLAAMRDLVGADTPDVSDRVERLLGDAAFAERWNAAVAPASDGGSGAESRERFDTVADSLLDAFATLDTLRLLLGPLDHDPH